MSTILLIVKISIDIRIEKVKTILYQEYTKEVKKLDTIGLKAENTMYILKRKMELSNIKLDDSNIEGHNLTFNDLLESYLAEIANSDANIYIPENIKPTIIKILQEDLNTDNPNIEVLISLAQQKISEETLKRELKIEN